MKLIVASQTKEFKNSESCMAIEYPVGDPDINIAVIRLAGRYPEQGWAVNEKCKEIGFVMKGNGRVVIDYKEIMLKEGDAVLIEANEKFYWDGTMELLMPCTPAWTPEQHKIS